MTGPEPAAGFREAVRAEWTKLRTLRSTWATTLAVGAVIPVLAVFVAATGSLQDDDTVMGGSLTGATLALMVAAVVGVLVTAGEHTSGLVTTTFVANPRRAVVAAAKATVVAAVMFVVGGIGSVAAFGLGTALLDGDRYASGDPWPALVGVSLAFSVAGLLGCAVGTLLRSTAGGAVTVVAVMLAPALLGPLFGSYQRWIGGATPVAALEKLTQTSDASHEAVGSLAAWPSLLAVAALGGLVLAASIAALRSRDV